MRWEYQVGVFIIAFILIIALGIYFYQSILPFSISPIHFFGSIILGMTAFGVISVELMRGNSPSFVSEAITDSINEKEIKTIPWNNDLVSETTKPAMTAFIPIGGINYWGINPSSPSNKPFVIQYWNDLQKIGESWRSKACLRPINIDAIPPDLREYGEKMYGRRFTGCPMVLIGFTSNEDGSANAHNERIWFERAKENKLITKMEYINDYTNKELDRVKKSKEKTIFVEHYGSGKEE